MYKLNSNTGAMEQYKVEVSGCKFIEKLDGFYYFICSSSIVVLNELFKKIKDFKLK